MSEDIPGELAPQQPALDQPGLDQVALDQPAPDQPGLPVPRWLGPTFLILAALTVPWAFELWATLPARDVSAHYRLAWVGFDVMLTVVLARTGWLAWRGSDHVQLPAVASATLLVVDVWFDIVTASSRHDLALAVVSALVIEVPLALLCLWIALNAERVRRERLHWALRVDPRTLRP